MGRNEHGDEETDVNVNGLYRIADALEDIAFELKMIRTIAQQYAAPDLKGHIRAEVAKFWGEDS